MNVPRASLRPSLNECSLIETLRKELNIKLLSGIPSDLDTDLNLLRWIRGYDGNIDRIVENFHDYISSRQAIGFDRRDLPEEYFELPIIKPYLPFVATSRLHDRVWLDDCNAFLFVERCWCQPKEHILRREKTQGPERGPVKMIVLFDLACLNLLDYMNPLSAQFKLWQARSELWQQWYPELVLKIYLMNSPRLVSVMWKLAKVFLTEQNLRLIEVLNENSDVLKQLPAWFVPEEYGGKFINTIPPGDQSGMSHRRKITSTDFIQPYKHYSAMGVQRPKPINENIIAGGTFVHRYRLANNHTRLMWDFSANGEVIFTIRTGDSKHRMVYPRLRMNTIKVPEEGTVENLIGDQDYLLEFHNPSSYSKLKIDFCVCSAP